MALAKTALKFAKKGLTPDTKKPQGGKGKAFLDGLKDWITSPGGIITLVLIIGTIVYINYKTEKN